MRFRHLEKKFVGFVTKKASDLKVMPVLANAYHHAVINEQYVRIEYYVSKSKNGVPYLDSLTGSAGTFTESSLKQNTLWVLRNSIK